MDRRVALVTGAARGIGRTIATDLGRDHTLAFCYHQSSPAALQREYPEALAIKADLTTRDMPAQIVSAVIGRFGRLDTLVLNAGTVTADSAPDSDGNFAVNLLANDALLTAARPHLIRGACVVAISSVNAVLPATSAVLYSASKAALNTWVRGMAKILGGTRRYSGQRSGTGRYRTPGLAPRGRVDPFLCRPDRSRAHRPSE